jgi:pullulanase/glycogen debranching enzyme
LRRRQQRNFLAMVLLSQGVPMLCGGDEIGRSQQGNNNAFCQDNPLSWFDWDDVDDDLLAFTKGLIRLRRGHLVFHRRRFFQGRPFRDGGLADIAWFRPDGIEMADRDWAVDYARALGMLLNGDVVPVTPALVASGTVTTLTTSSATPGPSRSLSSCPAGAGVTPGSRSFGPQNGALRASKPPRQT